jgi:uncharacterized protein
MSKEILEQSLRFLTRKPGLEDEGAELVFHCGEPLSVPIEFYKSTFDFLEKLNTTAQPIQVRFSTNGTLIDQEWCDLIKERGYIKMRVSIDGPQWLHDLHRVDRRGTSTFYKVKRGIDLLVSNGIAFDVLCVLTKRALEASGELWSFFKGIGARGVGFCVEEVLGEHHESSLQVESAANDVRNFFRKWLQLRNTEAPNLYVRELDEFLHSIPRLQQYNDTMSRADNLPLGLITIGWDGSICLFSPELLNATSPRYGDFVMGNVTTHSMEDILLSPKFHMVYEDIREGIQLCKRSCKYFPLCGGGYPIAKLLEHGTFRSSETLTCRLRVQAISDVVLEHLQENNTMTAR